MQVTIYYSEEDQYLLDLVDQEARWERKSRSAVILSILEEKFEREKKIGEILVDLGSLTAQQAEEALQLQEAEGGAQLFGEILIGKGFVDEQALERALAIQGRFHRN